MLALIVLTTTILSGVGDNPFPIWEPVKYCTCHCCEHKSLGCSLPLPIGWIPCVPGVYVESNCSICSPSKPTPSPGNHSCLHILNVTGEWAQVQSSSSSQSVEFQIGVTRSYGVSDTHTWGTQVGAQAGISFGFAGIGINAGVSGQISNSIAKEYTSQFSMTATETHTFQFGPGVVWQWQFVVVDDCGTTVVKGNDLVLTGGSFSEPCCLPGYARNISQPHGECAGGPSVCKTTKPSITIV